MERAAKLGVDWPRVFGGYIAARLTFFVVVYPASIHAGLFDTDGFLNTIGAVLPTVRAQAYGPAVIAVGVVLGGFVGGNVASVTTRRNHIATGTATGVALAVIGILFTLPVASRAGVLVLVDFAAYLAAVGSAFLGAKLGLRKRLKWDRECEALDSWKTPSTD